jgi:hypothetical protein
MEIYCPQMNVTTTNSITSTTANIMKDYKEKKGIRKIKHKCKLLVSQMEEGGEKKNLGTFVHLPLLASFFVPNPIFSIVNHLLSPPPRPSNFSLNT